MSTTTFVLDWGREYIFFVSKAGEGVLCLYDLKNKNKKRI